jgi:hypothetical protein
VIRSPAGTTRTAAEGKATVIVLGAFEGEPGASKLW